MPKLSRDQVADAVLIGQLVADWGHELDQNGGAAISALCTGNCRYLVGGVEHRGPQAIDAFYAARNERVRLHQRDGIRTQRHTITNLRHAFAGTGQASATFYLVNYSAEGPAPVRDLVGPTIVADCRMEFRLDGAGEWRIDLFDSTPVFVGNDPFLNAAVVRS